MQLPLLLASASHSRRTMLTNAGLAFDTVPADIDERRLEASLATDCDPAQIALALARAKALDVASRWPQALVIGCDQTLSLDGDIIHKASSILQAKDQLRRMGGRSHDLNSAVALVRGTAVIWETVTQARLTCWAYDDDFLDAYLAMEGDSVLSSVGCYRLEGRGIQLFQSIEGDYFTILGLPLLPLLAELRRLDSAHG
jgi:septum formation protein